MLCKLHIKLQYRMFWDVGFAEDSEGQREKEKEKKKKVSGKKLMLKMMQKH